MANFTSRVALSSRLTSSAIAASSKSESEVSELEESILGDNYLDLNDDIFTLQLHKALDPSNTAKYFSLAETFGSGVMVDFS